MLRRAMGSRPSPTMALAMGASPRPKIASRKLVCRSSSACMAVSVGKSGVGDFIGGPRLADENAEIGNVAVPLDEGRHRSEEAQGFAIERPDRAADGCAMVVDENGRAVGVVGGVAGEMDF